MVARVLLGDALSGEAFQHFHKVAAIENTTDDRLDFTGVRHVSAEYLDALLAGQRLESLDGRILGLEGAVDEALAAWAERQQAARPLEVERPRSKRREKTSTPTRQTAPTLAFTRRDVEGERFTPTQLVSRLKRQLTGYIESAYPLNDPTLVRARRKLLDEAAGGHLLAQEPYIVAGAKLNISKLVT
jgi:hypothetical protein